MSLDSFSDPTRPLNRLYDMFSEEGLPSGLNVRHFDSFPLYFYHDQCARVSNSGCCQSPVALETNRSDITASSTPTRRMEELETLEGTECPECPGPPPEFRLPPPPRPPFLTEGTFCSEAPLAELEDCVAIPMIDASYHTNPSLQSTALIITSAVILLLMAAIISVVFWKHKRKVQNILPCKSAGGVAAASSGASGVRGRGVGVLGDGQQHAGGSVLYEDLPDAMSTGVRSHFDSLQQQQLQLQQQQQQQRNQHQHHLQQQHQQQQQSGNHVQHLQAPAHHHLQQQQQQLMPGHRASQPTIEMLDVQDGGRGVFVCSSPSGSDLYKNSQDSYNPVYEELANGDIHPDTDDENEPSARTRLTNHRRVHASSKAASEDEFAEDELSVGEPSEARMLTTGAPAWGTCPAAPKPPKGRRGRSPRSLDRRRKDKAQDVGEFHEGMLLDALLQLYPSVAGVAGSRPSNGQRQQQSVPSVAHRLPYFVPQLPAAQVLKVEENPYETVPVLGPLHRYTTLGRSGGRQQDRGVKCPRYTSEYYGLQNQEVLPGAGGPVYTQVGGDYSDYSQPTDRLYLEEKYAQPVYYTPREPDHVSSGRLYQGQPDSSFGSDSGYSHHTSGTTGTTGTRGSSSRVNHRKDKQHRNSHHSIDYVVS
ncbi:uncharacterized protein LOC124408281 [Diprion similis]|uniref:uncharacterized protein LOC124408281 n=1 Tax=Diprion similis TaxID=362088 RepID=UPI001EF96F10|nr:uncharacterized protein LOC124408281 [Diprion similis]